MSADPMELSKKGVREPSMMDISNHFDWFYCLFIKAWRLCEVICGAGRLVCAMIGRRSASSMVSH